MGEGLTLQGCPMDRKKNRIIFLTDIPKIRIRNTLSHDTDASLTQKIYFRCLILINQNTYQAPWFHLSIKNQLRSSDISKLLCSLNRVCVNTKYGKPQSTKINNLNFHSLEVVSFYHDPQLQNYFNPYNLNHKTGKFIVGLHFSIIFFLRRNIKASLKMTTVLLSPLTLSQYNVDTTFICNIR